MAVLDRDAVVDRWRRAEAKIYPSVMLNTSLYQDYIAGAQFAPAAIVRLAVHHDGPLFEEPLNLAAGLHKIGQFQKLAERDVFRMHLYRPQVFRILL